MRELLEKLLRGERSLFRLSLPFRVRLFNVLALFGGMISLINGISSYTNNQDRMILGVNLAIAALSFFLLFYASKSRRYQFCYLVTIVMIFFLMFPYLFFKSGGYKGGMISFYMFGILFTVFMLEGKIMLFTAILEMLVYIATILIAYRNPQTVTWFLTEKEVITDLLVGFTVSSVSIAAVMYLHFRMYNKQQKILEEARVEAQSANKAKSAFLANMSHEIRTPVNVMLGMNEMILRESENEEIRQYAKSIERSGNYLTSLINNVLDISRIESGKMEIEEGRYELRQLLDETMLIGEKQAEQKGLKIVLEVDETLPGYLIGDMIHIKQILLNLINNAVKYTREGQITLRVREGLLDEQKQILFSVADTGIGIRKADQAMLFDAFTRVDHRKNQSIEGTGLGLSIAKQLTEQMGGVIRVESTYGKGSCFLVTLPMKEASEEKISKIERKEESRRRRSCLMAPNAKILVVDDNGENRMVVKSLLKRTGIFIDFAISGAECVRKVQAVCYDLILLDYMMPDMDGIETIRVLKQNPAFDTPVIALSADVTKGIEQTFLKEGFCAYLSKPILWNRLEDLLMQYLSPELVLLCEEDAEVPELDAAFLNEIAQPLKENDILMEEGLRLLSGDFVQYRKLVEFFVEYQREHMKQMEQLLNQNVQREVELEELTRMMHTLKSNAKAIGAHNLYAIAQELEARGKKKDIGYIVSGYSLLIYEWKRVWQAAQQFLDDTQDVTAHEALPEKVSAKRSEKEAREKIKNLILRYQAKEAKKEIRSVLNAGISTEECSLLEAMDKAIDRLEFEEAERLLGQWEEME